MWFHGQLLQKFLNGFKSLASLSHTSKLVLPTTWINILQKLLECDGLIAKTTWDEKNTTALR